MDPTQQTTQTSSDHERIEATLAEGGTVDITTRGRDAAVTSVSSS